MKTSHIVLVAAAAVIAVVVRLVPMPVANFSALGALAILSAVLVRPVWLAVMIPLSCRLLSDLLIHTSTGYGFYHSMGFDYSAYVLIAGLGYLIQPRNHATMAATSIGATGLFFAVSNLGVWCMPHAGQYLYPQTLAGLQSCFVSALPYVRGTFLGDLAFSLIFVSVLQMVSAESTQPVTGEIE